MKRITLTLCLLLIGFAVVANESIRNQQGPEYANETSKAIIQKMIEAHGGYEKWSQIETMAFTTAMHSESLGFLRFWIKDQVIEMKSRRTYYQDWPLVGSKMSYDGKKVWSEDWRVGNPPSHQHSVFFYYLNLPWLTQDEGVKIGKAELIEHKAFDNKVYKVRMSYTKSPVLGKSAKDSYTLYIDSETFLLSGYEYTVGYGPMLDILGLPKDQDVFGPVLRKNNYTADLNGLKFPVLFTTHDTEMKSQYGDHAIYDIKFNEGFDESRMKPSKNAVFDPAKDVRKK